MAVEKMRGCGFRKVNGLYLCGEGASMNCDRLPYELEVCPVCGGGVKFTRGFTWLDWCKYAGVHKEKCKCPGLGCPVCHPRSEPQPYGLLWIGEQFYTPEEFVIEALTMGVSRRIAAIPRNFKLGTTWILYAHKKALGTRTLDDGKVEPVPGVFYASRPTRVDKLVWESEATEEVLTDLDKKGITPVIIPDGDVDHDSKTPLKMSKDDREEAQTLSKVEQMRASIRG